jgi:hypothetical protein
MAKQNGLGVLRNRWCCGKPRLPSEMVVMSLRDVLGG